MPAIRRASFVALGTRISLLGVAMSAREMHRARALAERKAEEWEQHFSRFRRGSELSRVNAARGEPTSVSPQFLALLEAALDGIRRTQGAFDPTMLAAIEAAGYREDFAAVLRGRPETGPPIPGRGLRLLDDLEVNRPMHTVRLPAGVGLDFGGIAKGAFADELASVFGHWEGGVVDAGGDMRLWGRAPGGRAWRIGVEAPHRNATDTCCLELPSGATLGIATSATNRRRWRMADGVERHHLLDPATGLSLGASTPSVTVVAHSATEAEIATKSFLVASARGETMPKVPGTIAIVVWPDGRVEVIDGTLEQNGGPSVGKADRFPA